MSFVVMGVSGCGKTTVGQLLASRLGLEFLDGDHFHPESNIKKMQSGTPLTDEDRLPWLNSLSENSVALGPCVLGCSALKKRYRDVIRSHAVGPLSFVWLKGTKDLLLGRVSSRKGHFMPASLLDSQFAALEPLDETEEGIIAELDTFASLEDLVDFIVLKIRTR
jgi:carbohydrate kinase (thermoresistant glucokinase family)